MTLVVSDTSPINLLVCLRREKILAELFDSVLIPPEVLKEMSHARAPVEVRQCVSAPPAWLSVRAPTRTLPILKLDPGEIEAISLALELQATLMIDERDRREIAVANGLKIIGAIGVLERAANAGFIKDLKRVHDQIRATKFRVADDVLTNSLARHLANQKHP